MPRGLLSATVVITGGIEWQEVIRLEPDELSSPYSGTVLSTAGRLKLLNAVALPARVRCVLRVRIGQKNHRGGSGIMQHFTLAGNPLEFSGNICYVEALLCATDNADLTTATGQPPIDPNVTMALTCSIGAGESAKIQPTAWILPTLSGDPATPLSVGQQVITGPGRIRQAHGFNAGANASYLMFFDTACGIPSLGTAPEWTIPLNGVTAPNAPETFTWDCIESARVFQYGLVWAISSTPDTFTADSTDPWRVDIELFNQTQTLSLGGNPGGSASS